MNYEQLIIIRDKTRLEQLIERFNSRSQAQFYLERSGGNFEWYEEEHQRFYESLNIVQEKLEKVIKYKLLDRSFLPSYLFSETDMVLVIGQDGLVANTAKYVGQIPILAVNPDPERYDGVLLFHSPANFIESLKKLQKGQAAIKEVSMAKASLQDGQELLAFNDFYIGASSHVSARYQIEFQGKTEQQSSSGILVSTAAGSTGWLSSVYNMARNINSHYGLEGTIQAPSYDMDREELVFVVREPFRSITSQVDIGFGSIPAGEKLVIQSNMPNNGIIFSDGIEADFLPFNSGARVEISLADVKARLVV